jgi:hypothetical protein
MIARIVFALFLGMNFASAQTAKNTDQLVVRDNASKWFKSQAWGGGAMVMLELTESREPGALSLDFLAGSAPELAFGCNSSDPAKSQWRFRAGFSPPGAVINDTPRAEQAYAEGVARLTGQPGIVTLFDEMDNPTTTLPVLPGENALETPPLTESQVREFKGSSAIKVETPQLVIETRLDDIGLVLVAMKNLPCKKP